MLGGHVIKVGLGPLLVTLMRRRVVTHVAMNGSAAIHDFELAAFGGTSEDVASGLSDGTFGMAEETGREMNQSVADGARDGLGMGEALVSYLRRHPGAGIGQVVQASSAERQAVYNWLFLTRHRNAQDHRIATLLEIEAFLDLHRGWERLGYPFASLTPSLATAIGSSGDRPAALAELMGIIVNNGMRQPTVLVDDLDFAVDTPYETRLGRTELPTSQVLAPEIATVVRGVLTQVVDVGTARVLRDAGYVTGMAGKWQVNNLYDEPDAVKHHGFQETLLWAGSIDRDVADADFLRKFQDAIRREQFAAPAHRLERVVEVLEHVEGRHAPKSRCEVEGLEPATPDTLNPR